MIANLLTRSDLTCAVNPEDPAQIFGYICSERLLDALILHWIYVKFPYRKLGLGRLLLQHVLELVPQDAAIVASHIPGKGSDSFFHFCRNNYHCVYDPEAKYGST